MSETVAAVLVHIDLDADRPHGSSLVALAAGRQIASSWGASLYAAAIVEHPLDGVDRELARGGADKVVFAVTGAKPTPLWSVVGSAWQTVLERLAPRLVLFGADAPGASELACRTAAGLGARLFSRVRVVDSAELELRDRDGAYARADDAGASVASIGMARAPTQQASERVDVLEIVATAGDPRVELAGAHAAELAHARTLVALGDDVAGEPAIVALARKLAARLDARLVGGPVAARAGAIATDAVIERTTALAPDVCVVIGAAELDLAGAVRVIQLGPTTSKHVDGALDMPIAAAIDQLVARLERA